MRLIPRLLTFVVAASTVGVVGPAALAAPPSAPFHVPFPCGETWTGSSRAGHSPSSKAVDFNRNPDEGAPVVAAAAGVVTTAQATIRGGYGRWVVIDHGSGESTLYAHLSRVTVTLGQRVDQGMMIGTVGNTGNSSGAHLHYEQKLGSRVVQAWFGGAAYRYGPITSRNCVDVPMAGNFVGGPAHETAVYQRSAASRFIIRLPGGGTSEIPFGKAFDEPVVGDWDGNGITDVGVRTPSLRQFQLRTSAGVTTIRYGRPTDRAISGDWNGDGRHDVGVRRAEEGTFLLRMPNGKTRRIWLGDSDDIPVTGDWDGDGTTDLGVFDPSTAAFTLRTVRRDRRSVLKVRVFGVPGDLPVPGDWNGDGVTDLGVWSPESATFRQATARVPHAVPRRVRAHRFGRAR